jgi:hypothetical protein
MKKTAVAIAIILSLNLLGSLASVLLNPSHAQEEPAPTPEPAPKPERPSGD